MVGAQAAEKVGSIWGSAVLQGLNVNPPAPKPRQKSWFNRMFERFWNYKTPLQLPN